MLIHIPFYGSLMGRQLTEKVKATTAYVLVYGAIEAHSVGERGCIASNKTIAQETGLKESSVATIISTLAKAGWVRVNLTEKNQRTGVDPLMVIKPPFNGDKTPLQSPLNIEYSNKNTVIEKDNTSASPTDSGTGQGEAQGLESVPRRCKIHSSQPNKDCPSCSTDQRKLFDNLVQELGLSRAAFSAERRAKLKNRLKEFSADEMITAAKNIKKDPFMQGKNERKKFYGTMEYLLRNDGNVEKWLVAAEAPKKAIF